jgi:hypothetical protein
MKKLLLIPALFLVACNEARIQLQYTDCSLPMDHMDELHRQKLGADTRVVISNRQCQGSYTESTVNGAIKDSITCVYQDSIYGVKNISTSSITGVGTSYLPRNSSHTQSRCEYKLN